MKGNKDAKKEIGRVERLIPRPLREWVNICWLGKARRKSTEFKLWNSDLV